MNHNKLIQAAMQQQPQGVQLATPINDIQLVALLAAGIDEGTPTDSVAKAMEILAEAIVQMQDGSFARMVNAKAALRRELG